MFVFLVKSFYCQHGLISSIAVAIILTTATSLMGISSVEARDNSLLGYYLQLYNSINSYRAKHTIPALKWNQTLTESAEYYAGRILNVPNTFDMEEAEGLDFFLTPGTIRPSPAFVTGTWYNESVFYNYNNPGYSPTYLNFTQMIWKSSTAVGIGSHTNHNHTSVVAMFYPAGNVRGKFRQNVIPKYKKL